MAQTLISSTLSGKAVYSDSAFLNLSLAENRVFLREEMQR